MMVRRGVIVVGIVWTMMDGGCTAITISSVAFGSFGG